MIVHFVAFGLLAGCDSSEVEDELYVNTDKREYAVQEAVVIRVVNLGEQISASCIGSSGIPELEVYRLIDGREQNMESISQEDVVWNNNSQNFANCDIPSGYTSQFEMQPESMTEDRPIRRGPGWYVARITIPEWQLELKPELRVEMWSPAFRVVESG